MNKSQFKDVKFVDLKELFANQDEIDSDVLNEKLNGKNHSTCYVAILNGKSILIDGHHTAICKLLTGKLKVKARVFQIE